MRQQQLVLLMQLPALVNAQESQYIEATWKGVPSPQAQLLREATLEKGQKDQVGG